MTWTLHTGNALEIMPTLPERSVHCVVTSPPYWGLRDYGDPGQPWPAVRYQPLPGMPEIEIPEQVAALGLEPDPYTYVGHLVAIFREVRRILRDDGTLWLNIGDSYARAGDAPPRRDHSNGKPCGTRGEQGYASASAVKGLGLAQGCKPKDLAGIPWLLAFALRSDGWYLRSEIIWAKPNPMPESVRDRPTKGHEQVFLFSKSPRYWYDAQAIGEDPSVGAVVRIAGSPKAIKTMADGGRAPIRGYDEPTAYATRNARTVWPICSQPYAGAHFATMPPALAERCIKAGCPADGVVFDPFAGSGTTGEQALLLGRRFDGTELSEEYSVLARERLLGAAERAGVVDAEMAAQSNRPVQIGLFTNER